jgi:hypothetical protein
MDVIYTPSNTIARFMQSSARTRMLMGPFGSGKSTGCIMEIFRRCAEMPLSNDGTGKRRSRWAIVRNTADQLKQSTRKSWLQWFPDGIAGHWRESDKAFHLRVGDIDAEILFLPLDTPDDQRRLLSLELTGGWINEARELPLELVMALQGRVGRYPNRSATVDKQSYWHGIIMDTNPPSEDHWIYEKFEVEKPDGWEIFKQPGGLDPDAENRENLPETYYEDMSVGATKDWIRSHVDGRYSRSMIGRAVYENTFVPEFHTAKQPLLHIKDAQYPLCIGLDFGRTPSAVIGQRTPRGQILAYSEVYADNMGLDKFITTMLQPHLGSMYPGQRVYVCGDPAGAQKSQLSEQTAFDVLKQHGFSAYRAPTNDPAKRIMAVERQLAYQVEGQPLLLIDPRCSRLLKAMKGAYKYKRKQDGTYEPSPMKDEWSHISDAFQYFCLGVDGMIADRAAFVYTPPQTERVSAIGWT